MTKASKTKIKKRSIVIYGHKTSISIEDEFWIFLKKFAEAQGIHIYNVVENIDKERDEKNLSSAIRLFCFQLALKSQPMVDNHGK